MGTHRYPKVIFWQSGPVATSEERDDAATYGPGVVFRNAQHDSKDGALEKCDGMAGAIPDRYKLRNSPAYSPQAMRYTDWIAKNKPSFTRDLDKGKVEDTYVVGPGRQAVRTQQEQSGGNRPDNGGYVGPTVSTTDAAAAWSQNA